MAERTTITQATQIGIESVAGTGVAASKKLLAVSIAPSIKAETTPFRPQGAKYPTTSSLGKEWAEAAIEGIGCYNHLTYLLSSLINKPTPAQQGATTAYLWTFTPNQSAEDTIATLTVESGSSVRAGKFVNGIVNDMTLTFTRDEVAIGGTMMGAAYEDNQTLTGSPTDVAVQQILPTAVDVFIDPSSAALGTTKMTRVVSAEFAISGRFGQFWALNSAVSGPSAYVEATPTATLKLLMEADAAGMALLTSLRAGTKQFVRIQAEGPTIATTYKYKLALDVCGIPTEVGDFQDEAGVYAIEFTLTPTYDATWTKPFSIALTNVIQSL